jgi:hypothetical protein
MARGDHLTKLTKALFPYVSLETEIKNTEQAFGATNGQPEYFGVLLYSGLDFEKGRVALTRSIWSAALGTRQLDASRPFKDILSAARSAMRQKCSVPYAHERAIKDMAHYAAITRKPIP